MTDHLDEDDLVAWLAGDHTDEARVEEHLMGCGACSTAAAGFAAITEHLRNHIPIVVDRTTLARLQRRRPALRCGATRVPSDGRIDAFFPRALDLLVHLPEVPFDRDAGELLIACQQHFAAFPPDTVMDVRVHGPAGEVRHRYTIVHRFEAAEGPG